MNIFVKDKNGCLKETTLKELMVASLKEAGLHPESGELSDNSASWISIKKEKANPSAVIDTNLLFSQEGGMIDVKIYSTPIKRVIDDENSRRLV